MRYEQVVTSRQYQIGWLVASAAQEENRVIKVVNQRK